jgi:histidine triad (HIT) family protein
MREPSIFEKIVAGEVPCTKIRENNEFLAILDVFPNCKGQTLVIPKKRYDSDISLMPDDVYGRYMIAVKDVIWLLKKWLWVKRVGVIMEWMGVHHAHVKLYPIHGVDANWKPMPTAEKVWFDQYEGYLTTHIGEFKGKDELDWVAKEILN